MIRIIVIMIMAIIVVIIMVIMIIIIIIIMIMIIMIIIMIIESKKLLTLAASESSVSLSPPLEVSLTILGGGAFLAASSEFIFAFRPSPVEKLIIHWRRGVKIKS